MLSGDNKGFRSCALNRDLLYVKKKVKDAGKKKHEVREVADELRGIN